MDDAGGRGLDGHEQGAAADGAQTGPPSGAAPPPDGLKPPAGPPAPPPGPPAPPLGHAAASDPDLAFAHAARAASQPTSFQSLTARAAPVALVAGLAGLLAGPLLAAQSSGRYLILALDIVALAAGALGIWGGVQMKARLDYAIGGVLTGGVSLYFWIATIGAPPGGT
jgi:hypothetical protein